MLFPKSDACDDQIHIPAGVLDDWRAGASGKISCGEGAPAQRSGCGGENEVVREQGAPLTGGGEIVWRAADKLVPAIGFANQAGGTEMGDENRSGIGKCEMLKFES